jgi:hypothetical protein
MLGYEGCVTSIITASEQHNAINKRKHAKFFSHVSLNLHAVLARPQLVVSQKLYRAVKQEVDIFVIVTIGRLSRVGRAAAG